MQCSITSSLDTRAQANVNKLPVTHAAQSRLVCVCVCIWFINNYGMRRRRHITGPFLRTRSPGTQKSSYAPARRQSPNSKVQTGILNTLPPPPLLDFAQEVSLFMALVHLPTTLVGARGIETGGTGRSFNMDNARRTVVRFFGRGEGVGEWTSSEVEYFE